MPKYTVQDTSTGKKVTFDWNAPIPPTDADMEEVFAAAKATTPTSSKKRSWSSVPGEALSNVGSSAVNLAKGIVQPLIHPVQTMEGISRVARGGLGISPEEAPAWEATKQFFANRYGGEEELKNTIATDPVGFLTDISTVLTGGGSLAAKAPGMVGKVGGAVKAVGEAVNPLNATKLVTGPVKSLIKNREIPERLMESVVKYPVPMKGDKRHGMVETQFKYGLDPTKKGVINDLKQKVTDLNIESSQLKAIATEQGGRVAVDDLVSSIDRVIDNWKISDQPEKYTKALRNYKADLLRGNKVSFDVSELDQFTTNMGKILKPDFQKQLMVNPGAKAEVIKEAQMAVDSAARKKLADLSGIGELNAEQSRLLGLAPYLERANNRIRNWNTVRLTDMLVSIPAGVGGFMASDSSLAGIGVAVAAKVLTSPGTFAKIALMLKKGVITPQQAQALRNAATAARAANMVSAEDLLGPTQ